MHEDDKADEAQFFLDHIARAEDDPKATRYYASAFLSAARSVLLYALEEARLKQKGQLWYEAQVQIAPVTRFLSKNRNINVHERPLPMQANVTVQLIGVSTGPPPDSTPRPAATYGYQFREWSGPEDLLTLCRLYLNEIKRIVEDGRTKGFLSTP